MARRQEIPELGAIQQSSNACLFRVWVPQKREVAVRLVSQGRSHSLVPEPLGYHSAVVADVGPGERYLFDLGEGLLRPDPASRWQPEGVHGPSVVVHPAFGWTDQEWKNHELPDYVIYELHIGTFTAEGTFDAAIDRLHRLCEIGVTAVEVMPLAQFPGDRNWGYDGVYPFAVQHSYGGPAGLKRFVDACHERGLAVVLDVVYNHLGPEGSYLRDFGPYFTDQYRTPWGDALNFDGPGSDQVRDYFFQNALYWQTEFHVDALRLDAVHEIKDFSVSSFLAELTDCCRERALAFGKPFYLIAESDLNDSRLVRPRREGGLDLDSMWSDDFHHAIHSLLTGEVEGYYVDFGGLEELASAFEQGFVYRGQYSRHRKRRHGSDPKGLAPSHFVVCSQNHDQVGNRAYGERLTTLTDFEGLKLAAGLVLLSPYLPMLFMGEEYGERAPFMYFVSYGDQALLQAVREGRRGEFSKFNWQEEVPDPGAESTFLRSKLDFSQADQGQGVLLQKFYQHLLTLRREVPALGSRGSAKPIVRIHSESRTLEVSRPHESGECHLFFHFGDQEAVVIPSTFEGQRRVIIDSSDPTWNGSGGFNPEKITFDGRATLRLVPRSFVVLSSTCRTS